MIEIRHQLNLGKLVANWYRLLTARELDGIIEIDTYFSNVFPRIAVSLFHSKKVINII